MKSLQSSDIVGIVGGMGPMAGVLLQQLIIEATPAYKDQDHIRVICFTDPKIPDRTTSLAKDGGTSMTEGIIEAVATLERAGATMLIIACHTAHARFKEIQKNVKTPMLNLVDETCTAVENNFPSGGKIGLLATDGTIREKIFAGRAADSPQWLYPSERTQKRLMEIIYGIKAESISLVDAADGVIEIIQELRNEGAIGIVLGCTELSLLYNNLSQKMSIIDPLRVVADQIVTLFYPKN